MAFNVSPSTEIYHIVDLRISSSSSSKKEKNLFKGINLEIKRFSLYMASIHFYSFLFDPTFLPYIQPTHHATCADELVCLVMVFLVPVLEGNLMHTVIDEEWKSIHVFRNENLNCCLYFLSESKRSVYDIPGVPGGQIHGPFYNMQREKGVHLK